MTKLTFMKSALALLALCIPTSNGFGLMGGISTPRTSTSALRRLDLAKTTNLFMATSEEETKNSESDNDNSGVIELLDDTENESEDADNNKEEANPIMAPFLSQGEISEEALNPDLSDPKQTRVIIYTILSLLPVLFLIPLMLGSREFLPAIIPMDDLPPVQM